MAIHDLEGPLVLPRSHCHDVHVVVCWVDKNASVGVWEILTTDLESRRLLEARMVRVTAVLVEGLKDHGDRPGGLYGCAEDKLVLYRTR